MRMLKTEKAEIVCSWKPNKKVRSLSTHERGDDPMWSGNDYVEVVSWIGDTSPPAYRVQGLRERPATDLGVAVGGKCTYSKGEDGLTALVEKSEGGYLKTRTGLDQGNIFAKHIPQGFRIGGLLRTHSRVRHTQSHRVFGIPETLRGESTLNVDSRLPDGTEIAVPLPNSRAIYVLSMHPLRQPPTTLAISHRLCLATRTAVFAFCGSRSRNTHNIGNSPKPLQ